MSRVLDLTPEVLGEQGLALRRLARSLLGDEHAAEDVAQETWLACLKYPGRLPERVSAWIGTVAKHLALRRMRGESRRQQREERAAAPERLEALQLRSLEREEALRTVTQALLALDEPYKSAVLLRFYDDLTPSEIAAELGVPLATVKSRLARGLERLRGKLALEFEGDGARRLRALALLAGSKAIPAAAAAGGGAAAGVGASAAGGLFLTLKLGLVAAIVAGGALFLWNRTQGGEPAGRQDPSRPTLAAALPSVRAAEALAPTQASEQDTRREAVVAEEHADEPADEVRAPGASFPFRVTCHVRDARDLPLDGATLYMAPRGLPLNRMGHTGDEGRFTVEFDGRQPVMDLAFTVESGGEDIGLHELHLVSGEECVLDVVAPGTSVQVVAAAAAAGGITLNLGRITELRVGSELVAASLPTAPEFLHGPAGRGVFQSFTPRTQRRLLLEQARAHFEASRLTEVEVYPGISPLIEQRLKVSLSGAMAAQGSFLGFPSEEAPAPATLRGCVRDAAGVPQARVEVGYGRPERGFQASVVTDENGRFELADVAPGEWTLRAGGGDHGLAREILSLAAGEERSWNPLLDRGDEVSGRILLENGDPLAELTVELWSVGSTRVWSDVTRTGADGRFAFPNVAAGPLELHVYTTGLQDTPHALPTLVVTPVFGRSDLGDLKLRPRELVSGALAVRVLDASGAPMPGAEVRVWQASSGRGRSVGQADEEGRLALAGLPLGSYRVEVGGALGWRDLGTVWLDKASGEGALDLGEERFPLEGTLLLDGDLDQEDGGAKLSLWRAHPAVFALVPAELSGDETCLLAPGEYFLSAVVRGQRRDQEFVVTPEGASSFSVQAPKTGEPRITPAGN